MKFGKEFNSQMVQEWQGAYMGYNYLKKLLENIKKIRDQNAESHSDHPQARKGHMGRKLTMYRAFSGLTGRPASPSRRKDEEVITVTPMQHEGSENYCHTTFLKMSEEGAEFEVDFFKKLDDEFNKVLKFYEAKVGGVKQEAEELSKQMDALIAMRIKVDKPCYDEDSSTGAESESVVDTENQGGEHMDVIQEKSEDEHMTGEKSKFKEFKPASVEILQHVKINVDPVTPRSTLKNFVISSKLEPSFSKFELKKVEARLQKAFLGFHQQLRMLKNYSILNVLAFSKIMKKYDKITSRNASKCYLDVVNKSCLGNHDEVNSLIERVEAIFVKHFAKGHRSKGLKFLRHRNKEEKHRTTFFLGLFTGCSVALLAAIIVFVHTRNLLDHEGAGQYMSNIFPLYSLFGYIVLHMILYGGNTYLWRRLRVNYPFIFEFKSGTELGFREIFFIASGISVLALAAILSNLDMEMDPETNKFPTITELVPLGLVFVVLLITLCPFNIIYRSSRFFLIRGMWHCICAPLYKVAFADFFLADQLTSQVQAIRSLQFYVCYYGWGDFKTRSNTCREHSTYKFFYIVVAVIPFWFRLLQCVRRTIEEKSTMQALNGLKYFSTVIALIMRTLYDITRQNGNGYTVWRIMAATTSGFTTIYSTYWDIVIDWGLLQKNSSNKWLRDKLLISNKAVYFVAIVLNILLRLVWMQLVLDFNVPFLHRNATTAVVACLEILRRGIWSFFRLENEHFNNVENYRAFKTIPLPFYYENKIL
ncbi:hypothetical protein ACS0TY_005918 [Phlomoides rotata]